MQWGERRRMIVTVPAWNSYVRTFLGPVMRSHRAALAELQRRYGKTVEVRYVVATDQPEDVARAMGDLDLTLAPVPNEPKFLFRTLCEGHARGIESARDGDRVVLLNADIIISTETFASIERRFRQGKKAVVCGGTRAVVPWWASYPQHPLPARKLARWAIEHPHPITRMLFWGTGTTTHPSVLYFRKGKDVVLRGFHIHPIAVLKDRPLPFWGSIDLNLAECYRYDEIHVVTDVDELAIAEISHPKKTHHQWDRVLDVPQVVAWAIRGAREMHWWNFRHRVIIAGAGADAGDSAVADEILRLCPYPAALSAAL